MFCSTRNHLWAEISICKTPLESPDEDFVMIKPQFLGKTKNGKGFGLGFLEARANGGLFCCFFLQLWMLDWKAREGFQCSLAAWTPWGNIQTFYSEISWILILVFKGNK